MADYDSLIPTFLEITSTEDRQIAHNFLEMGDGDLDTAVNLYFENPTAEFSSSDPNESNIPADSNKRNESDEELARRLQREMYQDNSNDNVRQPIQPVHEQLVSDYGFGSSGINPRMNPERAMFGSTQHGVFNQTEGDIDAADDVFDDSTDEYGEDGINNHVIDLTGDDSEHERNSHGLGGLSKTQKRLARMFRPPWDIISKLGLDDAKKLARSEHKWVLINIQDVTDFRCQCLNRDFWSSNQIKQLIRDKFIFLQYQHDSSNGEMYRSLYPFTEYPHIAIIDPWTGERLKMWSTNPEVQKFIDDVSDFLLSFSLDRKEHNPTVEHKKPIDPDSMSEEKQIDMAVKQSLGDEDTPIELDEQEDEDKPLSYADKLERIKTEDVPDPTDDSKTTTRIQIRSGIDGKRVIKKFSLDDPVERLYAFTKWTFKDTISGKIFTLKMGRQNLFDELEKSIAEAGLRNASVLLEVED